MTIQEHIYNTRYKKKMNTHQKTSSLQQSIGRTQPIKIYNIKTRSLKKNVAKSTSPSIKCVIHRYKKKTITNKNVDEHSSESDEHSDEHSSESDDMPGLEDIKTSNMKTFTLLNLFNRIQTVKNDQSDQSDEDNTHKDSINHYMSQLSSMKPTNNKITHKDDSYKKKYNKKEDRSFFNTLDKKDKEKYTLIEKSIHAYKNTTIPLRFKILALDIPIYTKTYIIDKIDQFSTLTSEDNEYHKLNNWLHNLIKIPFGTYIQSKMTAQSSSEDIATYLKDAQNILNNEVYGHNEAKEQIIEIIASQISNPELQGVAIGIKGPPGNGKTTLIKNGISKALDRPFRLIGLGGSSSSDFLVGHDYTYEGSVPGKIIQVLQETKCMNPVIYFDELDKVSDTPKGEEIINLLCHLVDTSQNTHFSDKYFSGIDIDMSRVLFVFSYNDESKISSILLDRFIKINTNKFNKKDKIIIARNYLLPSICKNINFNSDQITFTEDCLEKIINNHTKQELGVRNLRRYMDKIITRINILQLLRDYSGDITDIIPYSITNFTLPITITNEICDVLVTINDTDILDPALFGLYS
tara:strand:+ start:1315 stop:3048 length:1734 start_codon:yes stop_codon:yes gene_type:complete